MLDIKFIRENVERVKKAVEYKRGKVDIEELIALDDQRREIQGKADTLKMQRNQLSLEVGEIKKAKGDASEIIEKVKNINDEIKELDTKAAEIDEKLQSMLLYIPNVYHEKAPLGFDETGNTFVKDWGTKREFGFQIKDHFELAETLDIIDFKRATKISGSGYIVFKGIGAKLQRALISFMLDLHIDKHGYTEILPPYMVNRKTMTGTGQLPKLEADMYHDDSEDLFLIPTAEVPVTNLYQDEILNVKDLPIYYTAFSACFRREAGSYGKDTRGLTRVHQFDKVEMVKFVKPETSYDELELLLGNAEEVLQLLKLPYKVIELCSGDMSFAAAKCYDIEVWAPGANKYLEVSSCSNFEDFQARRANIRFRREEGAKLEFVHTLNASGVALPRCVIAVLENYQQEDGSVIVPDVLKPYMGGLEVIK